ncbi:MAG: histidine phosphatase family protein [Planctomycetes bacterium]|nr:histidine phosphatase family protein [Planctomycetota bacterium]
MKTLILFRHGKSDWSTEADRDHDRNVSKRGRKAARTMGRLLELAGQAPDSAVTSSAVRARTTVELAVEAGSWACPVRVTRALYEATPFAVLEEVRAEPDATERLLLAGHEPSLSELASLLVGGGALRFPTACMARIDLAIERWKDAAYGKGVLVWLVPPKLFTEGDFDFAD